MNFVLYDDFVEYVWLEISWSIQMIMILNSLFSDVVGDSDHEIEIFKMARLKSHSFYSKSETFVPKLNPLPFGQTYAYSFYILCFAMVLILITLQPF